MAFFDYILVELISMISLSTATTLNLLQQNSQVILHEQAFLEDVVQDLGLNYQKYTSYMEERKIEFPQSLMQFYVYLTGATETDFPTSLFAASFPFTPFYTYITAFPWYNSLLSQAGMKTFYLPNHYATIEEEPKTTALKESSSTFTEKDTKIKETLSTNVTPKPTAMDMHSTSSIASSVTTSHISIISSNSATLLSIPCFLITFMMLLIS